MAVISTYRSISPVGLNKKIKNKKEGIMKFLLGMIFVGAQRWWVAMLILVIG